MDAQRGGAYLGASAIFRDVAAYLPEWIEFHRLVGVERFFLYDNDSADDPLELLRPYVDEGIVTVHRWSMPYRGRNGRPVAMVQAFEHCVAEHGGEVRWIAFMDSDEFLFSPTGDRLSEVLRDYERFPGVVVGRAEFGSSGHERRQSGLTIENYLHHRRVAPDDPRNVKTVADPARVRRCVGAHHFSFRDGTAVDEDGRPVVLHDRRGLQPVRWARLRIHHYWSRSQDEHRRKARMHQEGSLRVEGGSVQRRGRGVQDETMAAYGPAVRAALERRGLGHLAAP